MSLTIVELYDALRAAGVQEALAIAAARASLYGHAAGFIEPLYTALRSVGAEDSLARAAATADYRAPLDAARKKADKP